MPPRPEAASHQEVKPKLHICPVVHVLLPEASKRSWSGSSHLKGLQGCRANLPLTSSEVGCRKRGGGRD